MTELLRWTLTSVARIQGVADMVQYDAPPDLRHRMPRRFAYRIPESKPTGLISKAT